METKNDNTAALLEIEMPNVIPDEYKSTTYKLQINDVNVDSLSRVASLFQITRSNEWANEIWNLSNVLITDKLNQQQAKSLKELVGSNILQIGGDFKFELKLPNLRVVITDGWRQYEVIAPINAKLGTIDLWMRQSNEQFWLKKSLTDGSISYFEKSTTLQNPKQLQLSQILFDLYGPSVVYIIIKSKIPNPIMRTFDIREQELIKRMINSSKKNEKSFKSQIAKELYNIIPNCLKIYEHHDPIFPLDKGNIIQWDILIADNRRAFRFGDELFPNAMVAVIDCSNDITIATLDEISKKLSVNKKESVLQCLIIHKQPEEFKQSLIFEKIMVSKQIGLDLILILGIGAFIRQPDNSYIFNKDGGICLLSLAAMISKIMIKYNPSDIGQYIGVSE